MADDTNETVDNSPGSEYPKMLYKSGATTGDDGYGEIGEGESITVASPTEEKAARAEGYAELGKKAAKN